MRKQLVWWESSQLLRLILFAKREQQNGCASQVERKRGDATTRQSYGETSYSLLFSNWLCVANFSFGGQQRTKQTNAPTCSFASCCLCLSLCFGSTGKSSATSRSAWDYCCRRRRRRSAVLPSHVDKRRRRRTIRRVRANVRISRVFGVSTQSCGEKITQGARIEYLVAAARSAAKI